MTYVAPRFPQSGMYHSSYVSEWTSDDNGVHDVNVDFVLPERPGGWEEIARPNVCVSSIVGRWILTT